MFNYIIYIIDQLIKEPLAWYKLHSRVSKQCIVASSTRPNEQFNKKLNEKLIDSGRTNNEDAHGTNKVPGVLDSASQSKINESITNNSNKTKEIPKFTPTVTMPLNFFKYENATTVTNFTNLVKDNQAKKLLSGLSCNVNEPDDSFLADLVHFLFEIIIRI